MPFFIYLDRVLLDQIEYVTKNLAGYAQYPVMIVRQSDVIREKNLACYGNKQDWITSQILIKICGLIGMLLSPSFLIPLLFGVLIGYLLGLVSRGFGKNRTMKDEHTYFFQFDKSLLGLMLLSAFILGVFLTYFFLIGV